MRSTSVNNTLTIFFWVLALWPAYYTYDGFVQKEQCAAKKEQCAAKGGQLVRVYYNDLVCTKLEELK